MRRIVLSLLFVTIGLVSLKAQSLNLGIYTGVDAARFRISGAEGGPLKYKTELTAGASLEAGFSSLFSLQLEANFSQQGTGLIQDDGSTAGSYGLDYITVPLLAKLHATPNLSFYAGPQVGFLIAARVKSSTAPTQDVKDLLESTDFYAVLGTEYKFNNGVFLGARYNLGTQNLVKATTTGDLKNAYYSFRIGYNFSLKK